MRTALWDTLSLRCLLNIQMDFQASILSSIILGEAIPARNVALAVVR